MAESYVQAERFEGEWNGEHVRPKRLFWGHRFSDDEVKRLLDGETISFENGKGDTVTGKLDHCQFQARDGKLVNYVGIKLMPKRRYAGHTFSDDEYQRLMNDETVDFSDSKPFVSRKGNKFGCKLHYGPDKDGNMKYIPNFIEDEWHPEWDD